jgi:hypothetical protein
MKKQKPVSNRTPVPPAGPEPDQIETRAPVVSVRDPGSATWVVHQPPARTPQQAPAPARGNPVIVRVEVPKCPKCGHTVFRGGGTSRPNISTREMMRYRQCANCGTSHWQAWPMDEKQLKEHNCA